MGSSARESQAGVEWTLFTASDNEYFANITVTTHPYTLPDARYSGMHIVLSPSSNIDTSCTVRDYYKYLALNLIGQVSCVFTDMSMTFDSKLSSVKDDKFTLVHSEAKTYAKPWFLIKLKNITSTLSLEFLSISNGLIDLHTFKSLKQK